MIKQMKQRFLWVSMGAFSIVMLLLFVMLNAFNYMQTVNRHEQNAISYVERQMGVPLEFAERANLDTQTNIDVLTNLQSIFGLRVVDAKPNWQKHVNASGAVYDAEGNIVQTFVSIESDMTEAETKQAATDVYQAKKTKGWRGYYRYIVHVLPDGNTAVIFADAYHEVEGLVQFLSLSAIIFIVLEILVYILLRIFSTKAILPIVNNIERQKEFISNASHEIKTPLAVLSTNNDVMELIGMKSEWTQSNRKQIHRLNDLIEQMLLLARFDEGKATIEKRPMNVTEIVDQVIDELSPLLNERGYELINNLPDQIDIISDESSVRQLVVSILENAIKYHTNEDPISISWHETKHELQIENSCDEMTEAERKQLFDRFYRRDTARNRDEGGSGMGLSIAKAIAQASDIRLEAELLTPTRIAFKMKFE